MAVRTLAKANSICLFPIKTELIAAILVKKCLLVSATAAEVSLLSELATWLVNCKDRPRHCHSDCLLAAGRPPHMVKNDETSQGKMSGDHISNLGFKVDMSAWISLLWGLSSKMRLQFIATVNFALILSRERQHKVWGWRWMEGTTPCLQNQCSWLQKLFFNLTLVANIWMLCNIPNGSSSS